MDWQQNISVTRLNLYLTQDLLGLVLRSSSKLLLEVQYHGHTLPLMVIVDLAYCYLFLWNSLPEDIKRSECGSFQEKFEDPYI